MKGDICKNRPSEIFPRIRLAGCSDGYDFRKNADCQEWLKCFLAHTQIRVEPLADVRIHPYRQGVATYLAVDIDPNNPKDESYVIITIALSGDRIVLSEPANNQFDIELPGIVDALWLTSKISKVLEYPAQAPSVRLWLGSGAVN